MEILKSERLQFFSYEVAKSENVSAGELVALIQKSVPEEWIKEWTYEGMEEEYKELLKDPEALIVIARKDNNIVGLIAGVPHNAVATDEEFEDADPNMQEDSDRRYIEAALIDPDMQKTLAGGRIFFGMMNQFIAECRKKGIVKFSTHARISNGLSEFLKRYISQHPNQFLLEKSRVIPNWKFYGETEPIEYLEFSLKQKV